MRLIPHAWRSAILREMTPSWVGWVLIAVLSALVIAWVRGVGAELLYPLQWAVAYGISGTLGLVLSVCVTNWTMAAGHLFFGPSMTTIACMTALWSRSSKRWAAWMLLGWGILVWPLQSLMWQLVWRPRGGAVPVWADSAALILYGWIGFFVLTYFMTRSKWVLTGLIVLWVLQWDRFLFAPIALNSVLWHAALFAVFFAWGVRKRMCTSIKTISPAPPTPARGPVSSNATPRAALA